MFCILCRFRISIHEGMMGVVSPRARPEGPVLHFKGRKWCLARVVLTANSLLGHENRHEFYFKNEIGEIPRAFLFCPFRFYLGLALCTWGRGSQG